LFSTQSPTPPFSSFTFHFTRRQRWGSKIWPQPYTSTNTHLIKHTSRSIKLTKCYKHIKQQTQLYRGQIFEPHLCLLVCWNCKPHMLLLLSIDKGKLFTKIFNYLKDDIIYVTFFPVTFFLWLLFLWLFIHDFFPVTFSPTFSPNRKKIVAVIVGCKFIWIGKETLYVYTIPIHLQTITMNMERM
jgi:hypothetical protein